MNAKTSSHEDSVLLSQDEISEYLAAFGNKEVYLREAVLLLPVEKVYALLDINHPLSLAAILHRPVARWRLALRAVAQCLRQTKYPWAVACD